MKILKLGCVVSLALAGANLLAGDTDWYVDVNSTAASPDGKSWTTAFKDIQSAIDQVTGGASNLKDFDKWDRIHIRPGRYLLEKTLVGGTWEKSFTVCGVTDKALKDGNVPESEQVILDGQNKVPCMNVNYARIFGITFVNGRTNVYSEAEADCYAGAGLRVAQAGVGIVSNCVFRNCVAGKFGDKVSKARIYGGALSMQSHGNRTSDYCVYDTLFEDCGLSNGCPANVTEQYPNSNYQGGALHGASRALSGCIFRRNFIADPTGLEVGYKNGSAAAGVNPLLLDNCLFESNYFATADTYAYGTLALNSTGVTFSNLVFRGNSAPARSGISMGFGGCLVTDCSFIGNRTTATGSGVLVAPVSEKSQTNGYTNIIQRCLFLDNYAKAGGPDNSGVCIHTHFGDSAGYDRALIVRDCAFVGNVNETYGQACLSAWGNKRGSYAMISNCWFEANLSATNGTSQTGLVNLSSCSNFDVVDCLFKNNVSGKDGVGGDQNGMIYASGQDYAETYVATTNSSIRNCAFIGNKASLILAVQSPVTNTTMPGLTIENCTIAGNELTDRYTYAIQRPVNSTYRMFVYNTAIYGNSWSGANYNLEPSKWADHVFTSYIGTQSDARTAFNKDGNIVTDDDPKFADAATGDYQLTVNSPLRDAGQLRPWIDAERKSRKSCQTDLSNMQPVYDATGATPGCTVERTKICRRLYGDKPDIGAYEYNSIPGLLLILR